MMLFKPRPEPFQSPQNSNSELRAVPGLNQLARVITEEPGRYLVLEVDLKYGPIIKPIAAVLKARKLKRIQLDGLSLDLYKRIDGKRSIEEIIDAWINEYQLSYFEARSLCLYYLQHMAGNGILALGVPKEEVVTVSE